MIGPHGEKRPGNPIANAVHVAKLATGEAEERRHGQAGRRQEGRACHAGSRRPSNANSKRLPRLPVVTAAPYSGRPLQQQQRLF